MEDEGRPSLDPRAATRPPSTRRRDHGQGLHDLGRQVYDESSPSSALAVGRCGDVRGEHSLTKQESEVSIQIVNYCGGDALVQAACGRVGRSRRDREGREKRDRGGGTARTENADCRYFLTQIMQIGAPARESATAWRPWFTSDTQHSSTICGPFRLVSTLLV